MKLINIFILLFFAGSLQAQTDSLDNIVFKLPNGKVEQKGTYMLATVAIGRTVYEVATYGQQPALSSLTESFNKEWLDIVSAFFNVTVIPKPLTKKTRAGINYQTFSTSATSINNGKAFYMQFNVYDCGNYVQSVMVLTDSKKSLQQFDSTYQKMIAQVKKNETKEAKAQPFAGKWAKSASSPYSLNPGAIVTNQGSYKAQYEFKENGSYVFHGENWGGHMSSTRYMVIDEAGTYMVNGNQVILTPSKSQLKVTNPEGVVQKTETLSLTKRIYQWQLHYFEGIGETNLVLSGVKENVIDGGYASNSLFPSSFLYSKEYKPEWRIK